MVDIQDFGFIMDYALYDELPYAATGYIDGDCETYTPPPGYAVISCEAMGAMVIGGSSRSNLKKIRVALPGIANTQTGLVIGGAIALFVIGSVVLYLHGKSKKSARPGYLYDRVKLSHK